MAHQELELEDEWEVEGEEESEDFLGAIASGIGSLLGEGEEEIEGLYEDEFEDELESYVSAEGEDEDEQFLGAIAQGIGSLLGEGEFEDEYEFEDEDEAEAFFKGIGKLLKRAAPILRTVAKTAGPLVATAVGGPAAGMLARAVTSQLEGEFEDEGEAEFEAVVTRPLSAQQAAAEMMAAAASEAETESEAEALIGAATLSSLSARDRAAVARLLPHLIQGTGALARLLYGTGSTRQAMRLIPTIADQTAGTIAHRAAAGYPVTPTQAGRIMGQHAQSVLGSSHRASRALRRHARGVHHAHRKGVTYRRAHQPHRRHHGHGGGLPTRTRVLPTGRGHLGRPRPGHMQVVTPVRIPARNGHPGRTVRVVTDVKVPRGAVPASRSAVTRAATPVRRPR
jgi:hypothetical protein